jgi:hypothetical protein
MRDVVAVFRFLLPPVFLVCAFGFAFVLGFILSSPGMAATNRLFGGIGPFWALVAFVLMMLLSGMAALVAAAYDRLAVATVPPRS